MTVASKTNHDDENHRHDKGPAPDDMSDVTPPTRGNGGNFDHGMIEKVIKFRFVAGVPGKQQVDPCLIHIHWIHAVQEALGTDVEIINNKNQKIEQIDLLQWSTNPLVHQRQFKVYQKSTGRDHQRKTTSFIIHRIRTTETMSTIKNLPQIHKILRTNNCYMTEHRWSETEWDTVSIGFVTTLDPSFYDNQQAHSRFHSFLLQKMAAVQNRRNKIKIPQFKMTFTSPSINLSDQRYSTKAYAIETRRDDQVSMMQILKSLLQDTPTFVPFHMRYKYPEGFAKAIKYQTHQLTENRTIILQNINESSMYYMEEHIRAIAGIKDLIPAKDVAISGRFNLLVTKQAFAKARATLQASLSNWYDTLVPSDALPTAVEFIGPPQVKPIPNDGHSSGENSWMSKSNASFLSMDLSSVQQDDYFSSSQTAHRTFSYANALTSNLPTTSTYVQENDHREVISDITTPRTEQELETLKRQQREEISEARAIIEAQKREILQLKEAQRAATAEYEKTADEFRLAQSQFADRLSEQLAQADKKRNDEMAQMRRELIELMKNMLQINQDKHPYAPHEESHQLTFKRPSDASGDELTGDGHYTNRKDKRVNRRATPTKKLVFDEEYLTSEQTAPESPREEEDSPMTSNYYHE